MAGKLVIGSGFIGSNVAEALVDRGEHPKVLTRSRPSESVVSAVGEGNVVLGDVRDPEALTAGLDGVTDVFFCAGGLLPAAAERDPARDRELTIAPVARTLSALAERPGVTLSYLSSGGTIYGEPSRIPVGEDDPVAPRSAYGKLNLECERMIDDAIREHALLARVLRCSTVYGEHQLPDRGQGAVVTFLHRIRNEQPIDLYGGGSTIRDYVYVDDVARVMADTSTIDEGPVTINVGSGRGTSLVELLRLAEAQVGRAARVVEHPERSFDVHRIVLDIERLRSLTGFVPTPLEDGIARTARWLESHSAETA